MAKFKQISYTDGTVIIDTAGKISYNSVKNVPASVVDTSTHNHDISYSSKASIEDRFNTIMNAVQSITKSLSARPLKTKAYLNGGYKAGATQYKRVQRFNATTETGSDLGYISSLTSYYSPGSTSETIGYFHDGSTGSDKITYQTETCSAVAGSCQHSIQGTIYDLYRQTKCFVTNGSSGWTNLDPATSTYQLLPTASSITSSGRQMLSSATFGYAGASGGGTVYKYSYLTNTSAGAGTIPGGGWAMAGLSRNKDSGYWIGYTDANVRVNMVSDSYSMITMFSIHFSESNTLGGDTAGYAMGGYTYNGQHAKVQKMVWTTEVASTVIGGDLAYEQSSAGTCEA